LLQGTGRFMMRPLGVSEAAGSQRNKSHRSDRLPMPQKTHARPFPAACRNPRSNSSGGR
jgi:hypothetical protein